MSCGPASDAEVDDAALHGMLRVADIQHSDLASLERAEDQSVAALRHRQELRHAAAHGHFDVRDDVLAVEDDARACRRWCPRGTRGRRTSRP